MKHRMTEASFVKEGDWLMPKEIETPQGPESGPILYRILKRQESIHKNVTVEVFVDQLGKVMKDLETRLSTFSQHH